jgi:hypothetical protein
MGGGGGSVDIPQRDFPTEWKDIKQGYKGQENQYLGFTQKDPLLKSAYVTAEGLGGPLSMEGGTFSDALAQIMPTIKSGGALNEEQQRAADQAALGLSSGAGMSNSNAGIAGALLNRDQFRQQRFNTALGQAQGIFGQARGEQLGTEETGVKSFSTLTNPILAYLSDLNSSNQNAAAASSIAGANASAGKTSGTLGAVGSVVGGVAAAYALLSMLPIW